MRPAAELSRPSPAVAHPASPMPSASTHGAISITVYVACSILKVCHLVRSTSRVFLRRSISASCSAVALSAYSSEGSPQEAAIMVVLFGPPILTQYWDPLSLHSSRIAYPQMDLIARSRLLLRCL